MSRSIFGNDFQGGASVLVLTGQGSHRGRQGRGTQDRSFTLPKRQYDKEVKGFIYELHGRLGGSASHIHLPAMARGRRTSSARLGLSQPFLVLQVRVAPGLRESFSVDVGFTDTTHARRRLMLSSGFATLSRVMNLNSITKNQGPKSKVDKIKRSQKRERKLSERGAENERSRVPQRNPLHAKVPLPAGLLCPGVWINLCLDLRNLAAKGFPGSDARFLMCDSISIAGICKIRKVFTLRDPPPDMVGDLDVTPGVIRPAGFGLTSNVGTTILQDMYIQRELLPRSLTLPITLNQGPNPSRSLTVNWEVIMSRLGLVGGVPDEDKQQTNSSPCMSDQTTSKSKPGEGDSRSPVVLL